GGVFGYKRAVAGGPRGSGGRASGDEVLMGGKTGPLITLEHVIREGIGLSQLKVRSYVGLLNIGEGVVAFAVETIVSGFRAMRLNLVGAVHFAVIPHVQEGFVSVIWIVG